ncbi:MAG: HEPN domain-containing protein [Nanoarchaeota archaeon]|nr:HEPN domain-containing protein [Nanoarchaeota archaeon]MBU4241855.1 HEPN domain-containing protein [Nanoarchaeota archaeon]MBU4351829.1 HEPN domain-containing protein [Nanoarchaeota archaeon]MBU4456935.1 HEPN domain-containing protein [Nanoarchaeota archaeon]
MRKNNFLNNLRNEEKLELVEPSENICDSYLEKSANCLKSAKLLLQNNLYENSISLSYYAMYNLLTGLLFRIGIKCENHVGSILLLKLLFKENKLFKLISDAKKERIDKQYYVTTEKDEITKEVADELLNDSEDFVLKMKLAIKNLNNDSIDDFREKFSDLVG